MLIYNGGEICNNYKIYTSDKERKMKKRIISAILLTFVALVAFIPAFSFDVDAAQTEITFTFGANGTASHSDGSSKSSYSETSGDYTLSLTSMSNVYTGARDAKGNSALKLGASSKAASLTFEVPSDVTSVKIYAAKYKTNTSKIDVNGTTTTLTKNSNDGAYDVITVDTSSTKTITVKTVSGGYRCMIDQIVYVVESSCSHSNQTTATVDPTCTEAGSTTVTCTDCGATVSTNTIPATGHQNTSTTTINATCTTPGSTTVTCDDCGETVSENVLPAAHSYVDGFCSVCGQKEPNEVVFDFGDNGEASHYESTTEIGAEISYTVGNYTLNLTGMDKVYAARDAQGNSALKLGSSSAIGTFTFTVDNSVQSVVIYVAQRLAAATKINVNGTEYEITTPSDNGEYTAIEVDTTTEKTVTFATVKSYSRCMIDKIVFRLDGDECEHVYESDVIPPTCTEAGYTKYTCSKCGHVYTENETPATGHSWGAWEETVAPQQTVAGTKERKCENCNEIETGVIPAIGFVASFAVPDGMSQDKIKGYEITLPSFGNYTDENGQEYIFVGWSTVKVESTTVMPAVYTSGSKITIEEDTTFYAVYSWSTGTGSGTNYVETDISKIQPSDKVIIAMQLAEDIYALTNGNGTASAPAATLITVSNSTVSETPGDVLLWNISYSNGNLIIYPNGIRTKWLYSTDTNNGVRVGDNTNDTFTIVEVEGNKYLFHNATSRYIGVYNKSGWRGYTPTPTASSNSNIKSQNLVFYVLSGGTTSYMTIGCAHENTETEITATCTESGTKTVICTDCGKVLDSKSIAALEHDYTNGTPVVTHPTCTSGGYTITTCSRCDATKKSDVVDALEHPYDQNGICTVCGTFNAEVYDLSGKYYISASRTDGFFWNMTSIINLAANGKTPRYSAVNSNLTELPGTFTSPALSQVFVLERIEEGVDAGKYLIYAFGIVGDKKYIGWSEEDGISAKFVSYGDALKLTIKNVTAETTFSISFGEGDNERFLSLYNTNGSDFFAFYQGTNQKENLSLTPVEFAQNNEFATVSLNVGTDLSIRYHVIPNGQNLLDDYTVRFTMNGKEAVVSGVAEGEKIVFSFCGVAPQCMGDVVKAELLLNGEVIDTVEEYSVKSYVVKAFELYPDNDALLRFLSDMLYYGAAAQEYKNYKKDALVTAGLELYSVTANAPADDYDHKSIVTKDGYDKTQARFTAAGVNFDCNNKIFVKLNASDISMVKVSIGKNELELIDLGNGTYVAYSSDISALEFDTEIVFTLTYNGALAQTLTYTVNDYVVAKKDTNTIGNLVLALYRYGESAKAYDLSK